jgi:hypothetical protein
MVLRERDEGVSPVVGMILVLGISVVGIAAILYWGLPAIDEMKANVEHKSLESQFQELDSSIKELVAGTTEKTAKRWQPTLNRGSLYVANETEGWLYASEMYHATKDHDFAWIGFDDGNNAFAVKNLATGDDVDAFTVQAYRVNTTTSGQALRVSTSAVSSTQMTAIDLDAGAAAVALYLYDEGGDAVDIRNSTIRLRIYDDATKIAEAFYVPTGRIDYELDAGLGTKTVSENNGAVITGDGLTSALLNSPPLPPVSTSSGTPRFFARAVILNGTGSFAGQDRFDVLVTLYSTSTLASYDCADTTSTTTCVESTKLFVFGEYRDTWYAYLTNTGRGYGYDLEDSPVPADPGSIPYLAQRSEGAMGYTLLQSRIQLTTYG